MNQFLVWFSITFEKHIILHQALTDSIGSSFVSHIVTEILEKLSVEQKAYLRKISVTSLDIKYLSQVAVIKNSMCVFPKADKEILSAAIGTAIFVAIRSNVKAPSLK